MFNNAMFDNAICNLIST